jgi:hypothetical protein
MLLNYERQMCTRNLLLSTPSTLKSGRFKISDVLALLRHKALLAMVHHHRGAPLQSNSPLRAITGALGRKRMWDDDIQLQYPPIGNSDCVSRRVGFCRDGVHFYWLARAFLQPDRVRDWQLPADRRFKQTITGLGQVREWSKTEGGPARRVAWQHM